MTSIEQLKDECWEYKANFQALMDKRRELKQKLYFCVMRHEKMKYPQATDREIHDLLANEYEIFAYPVEIWFYAQYF